MHANLMVSAGTSDAGVDQVTAVGVHSVAGTARMMAVDIADHITLTDFARISILTLPRDNSELLKLQAQVFSGEYGPPAATIAEGLISLAIARGLKT